MAGIQLEIWELWKSKTSSLKDYFVRLKTSNELVFMIKITYKGKEENSGEIPLLI